jgi:LDH2 family malate/lactate/ureidoglycolate dehydrogenase
VFEASGVNRADAETTARVLVRTNLRGIDTHGVSRIPAYVEKVKSGEVNGAAQPNVDERDGVVYVDGDGGLGQAVAGAAIDAVVEAARERAVVPCLISNSGHLAAIGMFALAAAEAGMVAMICQETPPLMALPGSKSPAIGNNPIAFAAPVVGRAPLVFDMATSRVARGNIIDAAREGRAIPEGWATDRDGQPTTDPAEALVGSMLPIADHKGIGLAMMVQVLAGSLSGSSARAAASRFGSQSAAGGVSAFVLVINPDRMLGRAAFDSHVTEWIDGYERASSDFRYPGERAARSEQDRLATGIPLVASVVAQLVALGDSVGVPFDLAPVGG